MKAMIKLDELMRAYGFKGLIKHSADSLLLSKNVHGKPFDF